MTVDGQALVLVLACCYILVACLAGLSRDWLGRWAVYAAGAVVLVGMTVLRVAA